MPSKRAQRKKPPRAAKRSPRPAVALEDASHLHELLAEQTAALRTAHLRLRIADRMASIGALAAGLGHDMNNMLLPVRAHLEAARTMAMNPEVRDHVDAVHKSVTYLQQLADGLHFLALDTDGEATEEASTDLAAWWAQVGPLLTKAVPRHVKFTTSLPSGLPEVRVSAHGLTQAVLNLVVNAGEAIPTPTPSTPTPSTPTTPVPATATDNQQHQGHVRVWAEATKGGTQVRLGVTDNGQGMSAEVQRNAFEMFYTTKTRGMGTGLGLVLVAKVVNRAGGSVQIDSKPGKGTTVTLHLPVAGMTGESGAARPSEAAAPPLSAVVTLTDGRAAALIRHLLEAAGVRVAPAHDPADADIWVVEPTKECIGPARSWRARRPHGGLILFGAAGPARTRAWSELHPVTIENRDDLDAIGAALRRAMAGA